MTTNIFFMRMSVEAGLVADAKGVVPLLPVLVFRRESGAAATGPALAKGIRSMNLSDYISVGIEWLENNLQPDEMAELVSRRLQGELAAPSESWIDQKIYPTGWVYDGGIFVFGTKLHWESSTIIPPISA